MDPRIPQVFVGISFLFIALFFVGGDLLKFLGVTETATRLAVSNGMSILVAITCTITAILVLIDARRKE